MKCIDSLNNVVGILFFHVLFILIIVSGTFGNIISIIVWLKGRNSKNTKCAVYLRFLSCADLCVIFVAGFMTYMAESFKFSLIDKSAVVCVVYVVLAYSLQQISAWLTVAVTIQRTLCVVFPFTFSGSFANSSKAAYVTVFVVTLCSVLPNIPRASAYKLIQFGNATYCIVDAANIKMIDNLQLVLYIFMTSLIPLVLIITFNIVLLVKLAKSRFQTDVHRVRSRNISTLVISIGVIYTVSTFPWAFVMLIQRGWINVEYEQSNKLYCISMVLVYLNNAVNPWLYCAFGKGFRTDILIIITALKKRCTFSRINERNEESANTDSKTVQIVSETDNN